MNRRFDGGGGFRPMRQPPVSVGEELDVKIEAVGEKGDGIAKKEGFVLFVPGVQEGDEVRVRITKVLHKVGFAESIGPAQSTPVASEKKKPKFEKKEYNKEEESEEGHEEKAKDTEDFGEEEEKTEEKTEEKAEYKKEEEPEDEGTEEKTDADEKDDDAEDEEIDQADQY